jgi:S1-C subfamily serine protease
LGAKLTRPPEPNSPAAQLELEPGDIIVRLDGMQLNNPNDVLNHFDQTSMVFINVRTGQPQTADVVLPSQR